VQDSVTYESYPTHPLGARDTWPVTGPIYGIPELDDRPEPARTMWQRLVANVYDAPDSAASVPGNLPVWY
jgi:hypothetical protein